MTNELLDGLRQAAFRVGREVHRGLGLHRDEAVPGSSHQDVVDRCFALEPNPDGDRRPQTERVIHRPLRKQLEAEHRPKLPLELEAARCGRPPGFNAI
ncbi:hypothetical protein D3C85_1310310 [compost metagenome]